MSAGTRDLALEQLRRNPAEAARVLEPCPPETVAEILADAPSETAAGVLALLPAVEAAACLEKMPVAALHGVLQTCPAATSATLLRNLTESSREGILEGLAERTRQRIERALRFPEGCAGAAADPRPCTLHDDLTVEQAIDRLREVRESVAPTLFVIDRNRRVRGAVTLGQLLTAPPDWSVGSLQLARARTVSESASLSALAFNSDYRDGPVAVLGPFGRLAGVLGEETLRAVATPTTPRSAAQLTGAICELYWCGMSRLLGEALAIRRVAPAKGGAIREELTQ